MDGYDGRHRKAEVHDIEHHGDAVVMGIGQGVGTPRVVNAAGAGMRHAGEEAGGKEKGGDPPSGTCC